MALVRSRDTAPEMRVRRALWSAGLRYRLHAHDMPGRPDIVFKGRRICVLVHGCFWHRHDCAAGQREPRTNRDFWLSKFEANVCRDRVVLSDLDALGWEVVVIWECQTRRDEVLQALADRVRHAAPKRQRITT